MKASFSAFAFPGLSSQSWWGLRWPSPEQPFRACSGILWPILALSEYPAAQASAPLSSSLWDSALSAFILHRFLLPRSLLIAYVIYRLSCRDRSVSMLTMILSGMAVSTFIRGMIAFILTGLNNDQMKDYMFWSIWQPGGQALGTCFFNHCSYSSRHDPLMPARFGFEHPVAGR